MEASFPGRGATEASWFYSLNFRWNSRTDQAGHHETSQQDAARVMGVLLELLAQYANMAFVRTSRLDSKSLLLQMSPAASCLYHFLCAHAPIESQCARSLAAVTRTATATLLPTCGIIWGGVLASRNAIIDSVARCSGAVGSVAIDSTRKVELVGRDGCGRSRNAFDFRSKNRTESRFALAASESKGASAALALHARAHHCTSS